LELEHVFNGRYRVDTRLGTGGMAIVYCGTDLLLRRRVAIKVLRDQFSADDDFIKRFSYEAQAAAQTWSTCTTSATKAMPISSSWNSSKAKL
jgi:serine/threonine protein kinase